MGNIALSELSACARYCIENIREDKNEPLCTMCRKRLARPISYDFCIDCRLMVDYEYEPLIIYK